MKNQDQTLNLDTLRLPLSGFRFLNTNRAEDVDWALSENFNNGMVTIFQEKKFKLIYNHVSIGSVSFNVAATSSGYAVHANQDMESFVLIDLTHGQLDVQANNKKVLCVPGKLAAVLDFVHPALISIRPFYSNTTVRFTRAAIEQTLERHLGKPLRAPLQFTPQVDLSQPGPKRLRAILNQVIATFEQDAALSEAPLLVGQYEQLLLTALLTCLDHNASKLLRAPAKPAPSKIVAMAESFLEAHADKPLNLGDLSALTGMSARSIQLAFQKHRGYSPSRFLRECRLTRARDILRRAAPGTSLLAVSLACGFASQSLFCRLYRERFGEKPSETLAKT